MRKDAAVQLILFFCITSTSTLTSPSAYTVPHECVVSLYEPYYQSNSTFNVMRFYPIGWSKKGHFAYISSIYGDAKGVADIMFAVLDVNRDTIVSSLYNESEDYDANAIALFWKGNIDSILFHLKAYAIVQNDFKLEKFPFVYEKDTLSIAIVEKCTAEEVYGFRTSENIEIYAQVSNKKRKKIATRNQGFCNHITPIGCFKSPFEQRVVVVLSRQTPGWEGPPSDVEIQFIGCHLTKGFK